MVTTIERQKATQRKIERGAPASLSIPPGQSRYFLDDFPLPGDMESIFGTSAAKADFYAYITEFVQSDYYRQYIPEGKFIILSGALSISQNGSPIHLAPVKVGRDSIEFMTDLSCDHISEGDVDVLRWMHYYKEMDCLLESYDGDVCLDTLMQIHDIRERTPFRKVFYITRRSKGSDLPTEAKVIRKNTTEVQLGLTYMATLTETSSLEEAYRSSGGYIPPLIERDGRVMLDDIVPVTETSVAFCSSAVKRPRNTPEWEFHFVDMIKLHARMIEDAYTVMEDTCMLTKNPIENYFIALVLTSGKNDFVEVGRVSKGMNAKFIYEAFEKNAGRYATMVSRRYIKDIDAFGYAIDVRVLERLIIDAYVCKAESSKAKTTGLELYRRNIKPQDIQVTAAQLVWLLQYWGNGAYHHYQIPDGLALDSEGNPLYGYTDKGWAESVTVSDFKIAPPIAAGA